MIIFHLTSVSCLLGERVFVYVYSFYQTECVHSRVPETERKCACECVHMCVCWLADGGGSSAAAQIR